MTHILRGHSVIVAVLTVLVVGSLAFYCFQTSPASWFDEGIYLQAVHNITEGNAGIQLAPQSFTDLSLISVGFPVLYPAVAMFSLFGESITVLRLTALLFLFGFVVVFYLLSKTLYGQRLALWSTLFVGAFSPLYGNGKNFLGEVPGLFYFTLGLLLLTMLMRSPRHPLFTLLTGIVLGLAVSAKPTFILILPALGLAYLLHLWRASDRKEELKRGSLLGLGIVLSLVIWSMTQFGEGTTLSRIFSHYSNPYYVTDFVPLLLSNAARFVTETTPMHFLILLILASYFAVRRWRQRELTIAETTAFLFSLGILAFFLRTAGWYRYFFPGHVMLFLFLAPALEALLQRFGGRFGRFQGAALITGFALIVLVQAVPLKQETLRCSVDAPTAIEPYLQELPPDASVFFYNVPQVAARFAGSDFYQYIKMSDHLILGKENEALLARGAFDYIFVANNVPDEIERIPACYRFERDIHKVLIYKRGHARTCDAS